MKKSKEQWSHTDAIETGSVHFAFSPFYFLEIKKAKTRSEPVSASIG